MSVVGVILARGGSKGIPFKNLEALDGMSLIRRAVIQAKNSKLRDVYVYSDHDEILNEAMAAGATVVNRPEEVSRDETTSEDSILRFIKDYPLESEDVMLIQCTTPFLRTEHIDAGLDLFLSLEHGLDSVISATPLRRYLGYCARRQVTGMTLGIRKNLLPEEGGLWVPLYPQRWRRQDYGTLLYMENGGFYLAKRDLWLKGKRIGLRCGIVLMDWWESMEIDDPLDLAVARAISHVVASEETKHALEERQTASVHVLEASEDRKENGGPCQSSAQEGS